MSVPLIERCRRRQLGLAGRRLRTVARFRRVAWSVRGGPPPLACSSPAAQPSATLLEERCGRCQGFRARTSAGAAVQASSVFGSEARWPIPRQAGGWAVKSTDVLLFKLRRCLGMNARALVVSGSRELGRARLAPEALRPLAAEARCRRWWSPAGDCRSGDHFKPRLPHGEEGGGASVACCWPGWTGPLPLVPPAAPGRGRPIRSFPPTAGGIPAVRSFRCDGSDCSQSRDRRIPILCCGWLGAEPSRLVLQIGAGPGRHSGGVDYRAIS